MKKGVCRVFQTRKKKIQAYLKGKSLQQQTPFDELLCDYLTGKMKAILSDIGVKKVGIHIDWLPDYKCIGIQAVYHQKYLDLQIEPTGFSIGYDPVEPDEHQHHLLQTRENVYAVIKQTLET